MLGQLCEALRRGSPNITISTLTEFFMYCMNCNFRRSDRVTNFTQQFTKTLLVRLLSTPLCNLYIFKALSEPTQYKLSWQNDSIFRTSLEPFQN